jgi:hypothetical protein
MILRFNREFVLLYYLHENPVIVSVAFGKAASCLFDQNRLLDREQIFVYKMS